MRTLLTVVCLLSVSNVAFGQIPLAAPLPLPEDIIPPPPEVAPPPPDSSLEKKITIGEPLLVKSDDLQSIYIFTCDGVSLQTHREFLFELFMNHDIIRRNWVHLRLQNRLARHVELDLLTNVGVCVVTVRYRILPVPLNEQQSESMPEDSEPPSVPEEVKVFRI